MEFKHPATPNKQDQTVFSPGKLERRESIRDRILSPVKVAGDVLLSPVKRASTVLRKSIQSLNSPKPGEDGAEYVDYEFDEEDLDEMQALGIEDQHKVLLLLCRELELIQDGSDD